MGAPDEETESPSGRASSPEWVLAGRAWVRGRLQPVEIAIGSSGRIISVGKVRTGGRRRDVGDAVILPAATDLHVHLREPGGSAEVETISTGTVEAALGGVTLVGEMPNTHPAVTDADLLEEKARLVHRRAAVDVLLYASPTRPRALERLARTAGAFKLYLSPTTGIEEVPSPQELPPLLLRIAELGLPLAVHAEAPVRFRTGLVAQNPVEWNAARPSGSEDAALDRLLPPPPALRLHVAHVTTVAAAARLRAAGVSFEATPHHLLLSERSGSDSRFKVNPPLRSEAERSALWAMFQRGEVPCLASDHAPHALSAKELPFPKAPSGMPGVETMVPLCLARVRSADLDLATLVAAACDRPARWLGQPLGRIAPGHRANLMVVDFKVRTRLDARHLHAPCGWTAFEGMEAIFPREHYRDGERIVEDREYVGRPSGTIVRPEFAPGLSWSPEETDGRD
jgi:dihydroorotase